MGREKRMWCWGSSRAVKEAGDSFLEKWKEGYLRNQRKTAERTRDSQGEVPVCSATCVSVCVCVHVCAHACACDQGHSSPQTEEWRKETIGLIQGLEFFQVMRQKQWSKGSEDIAKGWSSCLILHVKLTGSQSALTFG